MRKKLYTLFINLIVFFAIWLVVEGLCYLYYQYIPLRFANGKQAIETYLKSNPEHQKKSIIPHPYLLYVNNPAFTTKVQQHNSLGYRNEEFKVEKDTNTLRILVLGGSTTYGFLLQKTEDTWPYLLQESLQRISNKKIEVINGGLNYATTAEILAGYTFRHRYLDADWIIYHGGGNDAAPIMYPDYNPEYSHFRSAGKQLALRPGERKLLKSNFVKVFYSMWLSPLETVYESQPFTFADLDPAGVEGNVKDDFHYSGFRRNLDQLIRNAKMDGSQVAMIGFLSASKKKVRKTRPDLTNIVDPFLEAIEKNKHIMQELGTQYTVPYVELDKNAFTDKQFYDYCHLKPDGEKIKAQLIFEAIKDFVK